MLKITLTRAYEPEMMERQPRGVCGAEFQPEAVLAQLYAVYEPIPADWDDVYRRYVAAVAVYTKPLFPSVEAVEEAEVRDPEGTAAIIANAGL